MQSVIPISIIIASYNSSSSLALCLEAVTQQMEANDELIVIDDCSTDNTHDIALKYTRKVFKNERNLGPGASRNIGARQAQNELFIFIDSDVLISPQTLRFIRDFLALNPKTSLTAQVDQQQKNNFVTDYKNLYLHFSFNEARKNKASYLYGSLFAVSRSDFVNWPEQTRFIEDVLLLNRMVSRGIKVLSLDEYPVVHLKNYSFLSLMAYDFTMGKYYAAYKLMHNQISSTTHVKWTQQLSILILPPLFFFPLYFIPLLLLLNIQHLSFCYQQRGLLFSVRSCFQLIMSYSAYLSGSIIGVLSYKKLKKSFL